MISEENQAEIRRLFFAEKWRIGTIAGQMNIHHNTVKRVVTRSAYQPVVCSQRTSIVDPFVSFIDDVLEKYPTLTASRLYAMVRERGYKGGPDHFRHLVSILRPSPPAEAYLRLKTLPGEQAQVDWGHFGKIGQRHLMAFVMVLSWSRYIFLEFFQGQCLENFLRGHIDAFSFFHGVPRVLLYDNLRSVVLERRGKAIRFHPTLLAFSSHYRFEPRPVAIARGNEKGRVERAIQYIRHSFFAARSWQTLEDLNTQARAWCEGLSAQRPCAENKSISVGEAFLREQSHLMELAQDEFPTEERTGVKAGKTPYVRFDGNDYSIPPDYVRKALMVAATTQQVRIFFKNQLIASHSRCFQLGQQIEDPKHLEELMTRKHAASKHRGMDRLYHAVPQTEQLFIRLAERGVNLGSATSCFIRLLDHYGATELAEAVAEAAMVDTPHFASVRLILERRHHQRGLPPKLIIPLPDDPRIRDLHVRTHSLSQYDPPTQQSQEQNDAANH